MKSFLLRVEGVNLANVLEDTKQLSVVRGGGLLLRQAAKDVFSELVKLNLDKLEQISSGASTGLFKFNVDSLEQAMKKREEIIDFLTKDNNYQHFTFVIDIQEIENNDFKLAHEKVISKNRFNQFQQLTVVAPERNVDKKKKPCILDNVRPANRYISVKREKMDKQRVSASIKIRHTYGRKQKSKFFDEIGFTEKEFVTNLKDLAGLKKCEKNEEKCKKYAKRIGNLKDKIAVLYFDGNGFGDKQSKCESEKELKQFDDIVQNARKEWLSNFLKHIKNDTDFLTDKNEIRLEILLWGGDEILLVVPAWCGFKTLQHFYQHQWGEFKKDILTHAGGLVFCHANAPIQRIQKVAKELAEVTKEHCEKQGNKNVDAFEYVVLESIDFPAESINHFWKKRYTTNLVEKRNPLLAEHWKILEKNAFDLLEEIPKSQVYKIAGAATKKIEGEEQEDFDKNKKLERFRDVVDQHKKWEGFLKKLFPNETKQWQWLHIAELWDYLAVLNNEKRGNEND
jgi:hypothetical protein